FFWPLPQSSGGNFVRSVACLFHVTTRATVSLQIKHIGFVLPTGSTNAYFSVHFRINFLCFVGFRARHNFHFLINRYRSQIDLPALLPLTHTTCVTHRARGQP